MFKTILKKLMSQHVLSKEEAYDVMQLILTGQATSAQISSFLTMLSYRGITTPELIGLNQGDA